MPGSRLRLKAEALRLGDGGRDSVRRRQTRACGFAEKDLFSEKEQPEKKRGHDKDAQSKKQEHAKHFADEVFRAQNRLGPEWYRWCALPSRAG